MFYFVCLFHGLLMWLWCIRLSFLRPFQRWEVRHHLNHQFFDDLILYVSHLFCALPLTFISASHATISLSSCCFAYVLLTHWNHWPCSVAHRRLVLVSILKFWITNILSFLKWQLFTLDNFQEKPANRCFVQRAVILDSIVWYLVWYFITQTWRLNSMKR